MLVGPKRITVKRVTITRISGTPLIVRCRRCHRIEIRDNLLGKPKEGDAFVLFDLCSDCHLSVLATFDRTEPAITTASALSDQYEDCSIEVEVTLHNCSPLVDKTEEAP